MERCILMLMCLMVKEAWCDYPCLCLHQLESEVFKKPVPNSSILGYLYEFECKPLYYVDGLDPAYKAIGYDGKLGFIEAAFGIQLQTCFGSIPDTDMATTLTSSTASSKGITATTSTVKVLIPTKKTAARSTVSTTSSVITTSSPIPYSRTLLTKYLTNKTTTPLPTTTITTTTITMRPSNTTMPPTPRTTATQTTTVNLTTAKTHYLKTTTARPTTSTNSLAPTLPTSTTTFTTAPPTTAQPLTNSCPMTVMQKAKPQNLFQHGSICYEFVPADNSWRGAQNDCSLKGGHLVSIQNQDQQNAVSNILQTLHVTRPVWLGLHDKVNEVQWHWDSGVPVTYTNWHPGRYIDQYHDQEDCGLMVPVQKHRWDDVACNGITFAGLFKYAWICQYK